jgi:hypothetical protein
MPNPVLVFAVVLLAGAGCAQREPSRSTSPAPDGNAQAVEAPKQLQQSEAVGCKRAGCSGELCVGATAGFVATPCVWHAHYRCYDQAECARQADGLCAWTQTEALRACFEDASKPK